MVPSSWKNSPKPVAVMLMWTPWIFECVHRWFDSEVLQIIVNLEFFIATVSVLFEHSTSDVAKKGFMMWSMDGCCLALEKQVSQHQACFVFSETPTSMEACVPGMVVLLLLLLFRWNITTGLVTSVEIIKCEVWEACQIPATTQSRYHLWLVMTRSRCKLFRTFTILLFTVSSVLICFCSFLVKQ